MLPLGDLPVSDQGLHHLVRGREVGGLADDQALLPVDQPGPRASQSMAGRGAPTRSPALL